MEELYSIKNGYKHNAEVIYGDTDSVMIKFGVDTLEEAMKLGKWLFSSLPVSVSSVIDFWTI